MKGKAWTLRKIQSYPEQSEECSRQKNVPGNVMPKDGEELDRLQKLKDQWGWSLAREESEPRFWNKCRSWEDVNSEGISRQWAVRWHDMTLATKYRMDCRKVRMEAGRVSIWQLSRKEVMVIGTWGGGRRDGKKQVHFGGGTLLSSYNIAVGCGGKHLITDDSLLYGLDDHVSNEAKGGQLWEGGTRNIKKTYFRNKILLVIW